MLPSSPVNPSTGSTTGSADPASTQSTVEDKHQGPVSESLMYYLVKKIPLFGDWLANQLKSKEWKNLALFGVAFWFLIIYPVLSPWLAAMVISKGVLFDLHEPYANTVRSAFRVKEMADDMSKETNTRLDYFQVIEFTSDARDSKEYEFPLAERQHVYLRIDKGLLRSRNANDCEVPKTLSRKGVALFKVKLGGVELLTFVNGSTGNELLLTDKHWQDLSGKIGNSRRMQITFDPVQELRSSCDGLELEVRATIEVFKDLIKPAALPTKLSN